MALRIVGALLLLAAWSLTGATAQNVPGMAGSGDEAEVRDPRPSPADLEIQRVVEKGLAHLARIQNNDGSWSNDVGNKLGTAYQRNIDGIGKPHLGVTAICCMR